MATTVPMKGSQGTFSVDKCKEFLEENGDSQGTVLVKTDQEPAIQGLIQGIVEARPEGRTVIEEAPKDSKGSNGEVERAVQEIEGQIRALFLAFQDKVGRKVDCRERIVAFIPEYAAYLLNRLRKGEDGKVAFERARGKTPSVLGVEFGEKVFFGREKGQRWRK